MKGKVVFMLAIGALIGCSLKAQAGAQVRLETTYGNILIQLDAAAAPKTAANFLKYVNSGFYDGTIFHRVIKGFMIQGGGFTQDMTEKPTEAPIPNEAGNGLKNLRGTIAMARTNDPNSATAQFFINTVDNGALDHTGNSMQGWGYCVFGKVVKGMNVVDSIEKVRTVSAGGMNDVPATPVIIKKAVEITNGKVVKRNVKAQLSDADIIKQKWPNAVTTPSGLKYVVNAKGTGTAKPAKGAKIKVHYTGMLLNGKVFDSSVQRGQPLEFTVGVGQVIPGWDEGLMDMTKGEKRTLIIPPALGYGPQGAGGGLIPPNATLVFEVELIDF